MLTYWLAHWAKKKKVVDIKVTVMRETAEILTEISNTSGLTKGEIIDRHTMNMVPHDPDYAVELAIEESLICLSGLNEKQYIQAFTDLLAVLLAAIPTEGLTLLGSKVLEYRNTMLKELTDVIDENEDNKNFTEEINRLVKEVENNRRMR